MFLGAVALMLTGLKAGAANHYVNDAVAGSVFGTGAGTGAGNGSLATPFNSLGVAITAAANGDTIYVDEGLYNEVNLNINKSLTIIGAGSGLAVFTGNATVNRFASITSSNVTIKNITLSNYYLNGAGQVITVNGQTGVLFENIVVKDNQGAVGAGVNIHLQSGTEATFRGCLFKCSGWNADGGGTIWAQNATLLVENCAFKNVFNFAISGRGGAIEITGASSAVTVNETVFDDCTARQGGAIFQNNGTLAVNNSCFTNNFTQGDASSPDNGGGAYCAEDAASSTVATFTNCFFKDNFVNPVFAQFSQNASCDGGCIQLEDAQGNYTFDKCSFDNLHANPGRYDKGQDFHIEHTGTISVSIINSSFTASQGANGSDQANIYNKDLAAGELLITNCGSLGTAGSYTLRGAATQTLGTQVWDPTFSAPNTNCIDVTNIADCGVAVNCATETLDPIIISCVPDQTITDCSALLDYTLLVSAYDDCAYTISQSPVAGTFLPNGTHPVTMTVTDEAGNFTTCVFNVVVTGCVPCTNPTPTGDDIQEFCSLDNPTIADLVAIAGTLVWYNDPSSGVPYTDLTTLLVNGQLYYASDDGAACDPSDPRLAVTVTIYNPTTPTITDATQEFCTLDNSTVADLLPAAYWYLSDGSGSAVGSVLAGTTPLADGGTYVAVDSLGICESTVSMEVTVLISDTVPPTVSPINQTFCLSNNPTVADLSVTGNNISWYADASLTTPLGSGTALVDGEDYFASQENALGCESVNRSIVNVSVSPLILADAGDAVYTICALDTVQLGGAPSGSGGLGTLTYTWSPLLGLDVANVSNPFAFPSDTTTYYLTVTDSNNCTATDSVIVNSNELPVIDMNSVVIDSTNCGISNGGITIDPATGFPTISYVWTNANDSIVSSVLALENQPSGVYTLTVTDGNNCTNTSLPIGISDLGGPELDTTGLTLTPDTCGQLLGSITGISASGGVGVLSYTWQESGSNDTIGNTDVLINVGAGIYTLTVYDVVGCQSISGPYTVGEISGALIADTATIMNDHCSQGIGSITGITASGGTGSLVYSWSDGTSQVGTDLDLTGLFAGDYTLTVTDAAGCETLSSIQNVLNIAGPVLDTSNYTIDSSACNASIGGVNGIFATGGVEPYSWSWFDGTTLIDTVQNLSNVTAGAYNVEVTDSLGCTAAIGVFNVLDAVSVTINASAVQVDSASCGIANGMISGGIIVSGGTAPYTYSWSDDNGVVSDSLYVDDLAAGDYTLTVTDFNLCAVEVGPITVYGASAPSIDTTSGVVNPSCNQANGAIALEIIGGTPSYNYAWTYNGTFYADSLTIDSLSSGTYELIVTDAGGCMDTVSVALDQGAVDSLSALDDNYITAQDEAIQTTPSINDVNGGAIVVIGGPENGTFSPSFLYTPNSGFAGMDSIEYYISDLVCNLISDTAIIYIEVTAERPIKIHTGFSPNGDGINETFQIENIEFYPENELIIFSRWGDQVFEAQPYNNEWDGSSETTGVKLSGNKVVDGAYYFILKLTPESEPINGFIDLRR